MIQITPPDDASYRQAAEPKADWGAPRLESAPRGGPSWSRWSFYPRSPRCLLTCDSVTLRTTLCNDSGVLREWVDPLDAIRWMESTCRQPATDGPPFKGGWIGYLSYDLGRLFEQIPSIAADDLRLPLFAFTYHDAVLAIDHEAAPPGNAMQVRCPNPFGASYITLREPTAPAQHALRSTFSRREYQRAVARVIEYIRAGDIFQANLSQRFTCGLGGRVPHELHEGLQRTAPAWFGAFLNHQDYALLCNSPELFLRVTPERSGERSILTRPIKGTRPRQAGMDEELRHSIKDQAELNMIVDLERNDLGRVCRIGSVRVDEPRSIEAHPTVYHGAATVSGVLRPEVTFVDILRATFPGGSITGAPKIRAMQIIEELEPVRRGPYCGAIGYLSVDGHTQFNIAIRTMIVKDGLVHMPVGGGIVADSTPEAEYEETLVKARAMFAALGVSAEDVARGTT